MKVHRAIASCEPDGDNDIIIANGVVDVLRHLGRAVVGASRAKAIAIKSHVLALLSNDDHIKNVFAKHVREHNYFEDPNDVARLEKLEQLVLYEVKNYATHVCASANTHFRNWD